ncbi:helix-turn-helix domain-containing protein [Acinetobacter schindleri]|uniref:helix-turn-helix domain-containing protein n=1 Tax=Acinetobacter schindleri TaxID=108981 RepID=UPI002DBB6BAF|nr:AraC family transcriptional regulator [Acinetobacter schindleri]MEB5929210.1 AraC family transcriptional regulator [Acinetobacter schindleri]
MLSFSQSSSSMPTLVNVSNSLAGQMKPFADNVQVQASSIQSPWRDILDLEYSIVPPGEFNNCYLSRAALVFHLEKHSCPVERTTKSGTFEQLLINEGSMHFDPLGEAVGARWTEPHQLLIVMPSQLCLQKALGDTQSIDQIEFLRNTNIQDPQLFNLSMALLEECKNGFATGQLYGESISLALAARIISKFSNNSAFPNRYDGKIPLWRLNKLKNFIHENLHKDLSIADLAREANLSEFYFSRMFKQSTGMTPHAFITKKKVDRACELLKMGHLSVNEISAALGFKNQTHFSMLFKRVLGMSPREFKNRV